MREKWAELKARLKRLIDEYGNVAIATYFSLFAATFAAFFFAIKAGFQPTGATTGMALVPAAWAATKLTQPVRILITLGATPLLARVIRRGQTQTPSPG